MSFNRNWFYIKCMRVYIGYHLVQNFTRFSKSFVHAPALVLIAPTNRCNLKCNYCTNIKKIKFSTLSKKALLSIVDDCIELGVPYISFTGGEPLLHNDIEEVAQYAQNNNIMVNLNTNGTLISKKRAQRIANSFNQIRISLDGTEKIHDEICGVKGTYERVIHNIDNLLNTKNRKAKVGINIVATRSNTSSIVELASTLKHQIDFVSVLPRFSFDQKKKEGIEIIPSHTIQELKTLKETNMLSNTTNFLEHPSLEKSRMHCDAGRLYVAVWSDGTVNSCFFNSEDPDMDKLSILGNIRDNRFIDIWRNKIVKDPVSICNGCHATCTTEISRIFRMSPYQLLRNFNKLRKVYKT